MKIRFNLSRFGIDTTQKRITNSQGQVLITATLESILSLIARRYIYDEYKTVKINHRSFANITNNYRMYLNYLRDMGIILISEQYEKGKYSKSYQYVDAL